MRGRSHQDSCAHAERARDLEGRSVFRVSCRCFVLAVKLLLLSKGKRRRLRGYVCIFCPPVDRRRPRGENPLHLETSYSSERSFTRIARLDPRSRLHCRRERMVVLVG